MREAEEALKAALLMLLKALNEHDAATDAAVNNAVTAALDDLIRKGPVLRRVSYLVAK